jgi:hypothetical protein
MQIVEKDFFSGLIFVSGPKKLFLHFLEAEKNSSFLLRNHFHSEKIFSVPEKKIWNFVVKTKKRKV